MSFGTVLRHIFELRKFHVVVFLPLLLLPLPITGQTPNKHADAHKPVSTTRDEVNVAFAQDLIRVGATIYEAVHERAGKNSKELTVEKADILQVLDMSRNWWKLRNCNGVIGYAPYTILTKYHPRDDFNNVKLETENVVHSATKQFL